MSIIKIKRFGALDNPLCVFGIMNTEKGLTIARKMLFWLKDYYSVYAIYHDGSEFEYPALLYMQELCLEKDEPCLYLHTKGAFYDHGITPFVRSMWKEEFTSNRVSYFNLVDSDEPIVACPFTGATKVTWYNGFVANAPAMRTIGTIKKTEDRYYYERLFCGTDVNVVGAIYNDVVQENKRAMHRYIKNI